MIVRSLKASCKLTESKLLKLHDTEAITLIRRPISIQIYHDTPALTRVNLCKHAFSRIYPECDLTYGTCIFYYLVFPRNVSVTHYLQVRMLPTRPYHFLHMPTCSSTSIRSEQGAEKSCDLSWNREKFTQLLLHDSLTESTVFRWLILRHFIQITYRAIRTFLYL